MLGRLTAERRDEATIALLDEGFEKPIAEAPRAVPSRKTSQRAGGPTARHDARHLDPVTALVWALTAIVALIP
ncbi:MAG: hypothetical protein WDN08_12885 [Rhizomicrobium sp.]